jgi:hypothetical protein
MLIDDGGFISVVISSLIRGRGYNVENTIDSTPRSTLHKRSSFETLEKEKGK